MKTRKISVVSIAAMLAVLFGLLVFMAGSAKMATTTTSDLPPVSAGTPESQVKRWSTDGTIEEYRATMNQMNATQKEALASGQRKAGEPNAPSATPEDIARAAAEAGVEYDPDAPIAVDNNGDTGTGYGSADDPTPDNIPLATGVDRATGEWVDLADEQPKADSQ